MDQTYGFFGFILYLLSFLGCGGGSYSDSHDSPATIEQGTEVIEEPTDLLQYKADYDRSLKQWNQAKEEHKNSYEYTLFLENSDSTYRCSTIVVVKNGTVYSREQKAYIRNFETKEMHPLKIETWTENQTQLGTHNSFPETLDEIYEGCNKSFFVDSESNYIIFTMDNQQLISVCGHSSFGCTDDCFRGVTIQDFKWLD